MKYLLAFLLLTSSCFAQEEASYVPKIATDWRVNAGAVDGQTFGIQARQARRIIGQGLFPKVYAWWPVVGDDLKAASNAMIVPSGVNTAMTAVSATAGNYTKTGGWKGTGTEYFDTGFNPVSVGVRSTNAAIWQSHISTNANGSSVWFFGNSGSGTDQSGLGLLNSGTIDTGLIGYGGSGAVEYPGSYFAGSASNYTTGFKGVSVLGMPFMLGTTTSSTNIPLDSAVSLQGLANTPGEDYYFAIQNDRIVKVRWSDNAAVLTNTTAGTFGTTNWDHFGDGIVLTYNGLNSGTGKLLVPAESISGSFPSAVVSNAYLLGFNTNTLVLEDVYCLTNVLGVGVGIGGCVMQTNGVLIVLPGYPYYQTNVYFFTPPPTVTLLSNSFYDIPFGSTANVILQSAEQTNGLLLVAQGAVGSGNSKVQIYVADPSVSPVRCEMVREYTSLANEIEGSMFAQGRFVCGANISSVMKNLWFTAPTLAASTTSHSSERYVDGGPRWIPGNTLGNFANNDFFYGAVNNNGAVAGQATNNLGQAWVTQGLVADERARFSLLAIQTDVELGRR